MSWEPAQGTMLAGKYRLEHALASGGMGSVWLARHTRLDADVAIKLMSREIGTDPSSVARFEREAKACAQLQSPHVVGVHDFGVEDGVPYMVMEVLRGEDLGSRIDRVGRMTLEEAVAIAVPIGKALRVAHDAGLIHRDLKPRNIFIARQGDEEVVKLVDFGIARETKTRLVDDKTATGVVMGSPFHMSPEQAQALEVDHRSDLWSLAVVLYRLITGVRPFEAQSATSVLVTICTVPHRAPTLHRSELPPAIDAFFVRALAKDPDRRFQSAREMIDAFVALTGDPRLHDSNKVGAYVPPPKPSSPSASMPVAQVELPSGAAGSGGSPAALSDGQTPAPVNDASASQALRAVSTGSQPRPARKTGSKVGLVLAAVAAVAAAVVGSLFFGVGLGARSSPAPSSSPSIGVAADRPAPAGSQLEVAPIAPAATGGASAAPPVASSASDSAASASASASSSPAAVPGPPAIRGGKHQAPAPAAPAPPPASPAIDPFTGLPVAR